MGWVGRRGKGLFSSPTPSANLNDFSFFQSFALVQRGARVFESFTLTIRPERRLENPETIQALWKQLRLTRDIYIGILALETSFVFAVLNG